MLWIHCGAGQSTASHSFSTTMCENTTLIWEVGYVEHPRAVTTAIHLTAAIFDSYTFNLDLNSSVVALTQELTERLRRMLAGQNILFLDKKKFEQ